MPCPYEVGVEVSFSVSFYTDSLARPCLLSNKNLFKIQIRYIIGTQRDFIYHHQPRRLVVTYEDGGGRFSNN